jgi:hypothetical protein
MNVSQAALHQFAQEVSLLMHEGEPDEAGEPFDRTCEDAISTLNQLILEARQLMGTTETCCKCGATVAYIIGCPDGEEVCQECADAG